MTKDEAIKKLWCPGTEHEWAMDRSAASDLVNRLEALGLLKLEEKALVVDHVDKGPITIKRNGKIVYED